MSIDTGWPRRCATKRCRGVAQQHHHSPLCPACKSAKFKADHPLKYFFNLLRCGARRCGARRRGHAFSLSFSQYEKFALESGYAAGKGRTAECLSIDRLDNAHGYHVWNIRVATVSENSRRGQRQLYVPHFAHLREEARAAERAVTIIARAKAGEYGTEVTREGQSFFIPASQRYQREAGPAPTPRCRRFFETGDGEDNG